MSSQVPNALKNIEHVLEKYEDEENSDASVKTPSQDDFAVTAKAMMLEALKEMEEAGVEFISPVVGDDIVVTSETKDSSITRFIKWLFKFTIWKEVINLSVAFERKDEIVPKLVK